MIPTLIILIVLAVIMPAIIIPISNYIQCLRFYPPPGYVLEYMTRER